MYDNYTFFKKINLKVYPFFNYRSSIHVMSENEI